MTPSKRVLLTGGCGFIGSHLAEILLDGGHHVTVIDDLSTGKLENVEHLRSNPDFDAVIDTILNSSVFDRLASECEVIFHLAAAVGVELIIPRPGSRDRDQHPGLRGGSQGGRSLSLSRAAGLFVGDLRQERGDALQRGERPAARPHHPLAMELLDLEGGGRVSRSGLSPPVRPAGHRISPVQHGRTSPDGPLRHGHSALRGAGPGRRVADGVWRRHPDPQLLRRPRRGEGPGVG